MVMDEFHALVEKEDWWTYWWWTQNERMFMDCGTMKLWCVHDNESRPIPRLDLSLIQNMNNYQTIDESYGFNIQWFHLKAFQIHDTSNVSTITNNSLLGISYIIYI
jgi:hypothetical protein